MNAQDLRKLLEESNDKLSIFADIKILKQYNFTTTELIDLIGEFLPDEEKVKLFDYPLFQMLPSIIKIDIIKLISDDNIKLQLLRESKIIDVFSTYDIIEIIKTLNSNAVRQLLDDSNFIETHKISKYQVRDIVLCLDDKTKEEIATDIKYLNENDLKTEEILETLSIEALCEFFKNNKEFCTENNIRIYEIVEHLDTHKQLEMVRKLEEMNLTLNQKRAVLAILEEEVKEKIDTTDFPEEYKTALAMTRKGKLLAIEPNLDGNLEDYRGLDDLLRVNPEEFTEEQREKFLKLCNICPNMIIENLMPDGEKHIANVIDGESYTTRFSSANEYIEAERWIAEVISSLKPEYSNAQKIAIIDNAIGKKISYSPDFETEVFDKEGARSLWKIIASGYGVCNGIAKVEQYILKRVGIESEMVHSEKHAFLKIKDLEIPLANGEMVKGTTLVDPTWNLGDNRFGGVPQNLFVSYSEIRKHDIDFDGNDSKSHANDKQLSDATLNLDEQSLRMLLASVGLADRNGEVPLKALVAESKKIDEEYANEPYRNICEQFKLLKRICPEFAMCQNSSMDIITSVLLNNKNLIYNGGFVNRVYDKTDESKSPILFVYIDSDAFGKKGFLADKTKGEFVEITEEEFQKRYACYEEDLNKDPDLMPWQREEQKENLQDTNTITSPIPQIAEKGGEER